MNKKFKIRTHSAVNIFAMANEEGFFLESDHTCVTKKVSLAQRGQEREREGATVMHPLWNHCNQGNGKCREKAEQAGECRHRGDEESRGTAASADQL